MIKNIIFDMGSVLIDWDPDLFLNALDVNDTDRQLIKQAMIKSTYWQNTDSGNYSVRECITLFQNEVPDYLKDKVEELCLNWPYISQRKEGMFELVNELYSKGYHLYLLSNAGFDFLDYWEHFDYSSYFSGIIVSAFYKMVKPNREIYELLLHKFNLKAEECVFIDDRLDNTIGAKNCGIESFQFFGCSNLRKQLHQLLGDINE